MNISTAGVVKQGLPEGFVYIDELIADCIIDAKYYGTDNFIGGNIDGYRQPLVVMSREVALGCIKAADILRGRGFLLKFFDGYRPRQAVGHFLRWRDDASDIRRKPIHYPEIDKAELFNLGYISGKSGHTRGLSVDLTIVDIKTRQPSDMGTIFDFMGARSNVGAKGLTARQNKNRAILLEAMSRCGFLISPKEWWHFNLREEPYPDKYFDFPVA